MIQELHIGTGRNLAGRMEPVGPDFGMGKEVPGLIPAGYQDDGEMTLQDTQLQLGDRVFMGHLRGGVFARVVSIGDEREVLGRVTATKGVIHGLFIDEVIRIPPDCITKIVRD